MIKKREKEKLPVKDESSFIDSADGGQPEPVSEVKRRREPRKYKSITLPMNQAEYEQLEALAAELDRSMLSTIRHAISQLAKKQNR